VQLSLLPHPDFPCRAITSISVNASVDDGCLKLTYRAGGTIDDVLWPLPGAVGRADGLWQHSCFEAFVARTRDAGYNEFNVATSGQWAGYEFDGYRAGMRPVGDMSAAVTLGFKPDMITLSASIHLSILEHGSEWRLGLSAVIEAKDGTKSYWALAHPPGKPDFHNADCFTARLAAPDPA
jgi:hypothetical protein